MSELRTRALLIFWCENRASPTHTSKPWVELSRTLLHRSSAFCACISKSCFEYSDREGKNSHLRWVLYSAFTVWSMVLRSLRRMVGIYFDNERSMLPTAWSFRVIHRTTWTRFWKQTSSHTVPPHRFWDPKPQFNSPIPLVTQRAPALNVRTFRFSETSYCSFSIARSCLGYARRIGDERG
jgi:hypothetical protein